MWAPGCGARLRMTFWRVTKVTKPRAPRPATRSLKSPVRPRRGVAAVGEWSGRPAVAGRVGGASVMDIGDASLGRDWNVVQMTGCTMFLDWNECQVIQRGHGRRTTVPTRPPGATDPGRDP